MTLTADEDQEFTLFDELWDLEIQFEWAWLRSYRHFGCKTPLAELRERLAPPQEGK